MVRNSRQTAHIAIGRGGMAPLCSSRKGQEMALKGAASLETLA